MKSAFQAIALGCLFALGALTVSGCNSKSSSPDEMSSDEMSSDKMGGDKMGGDKMGGDKMGDEKMK